MQYMMLYRPGTDGGPPPSPQDMAEMGRFIEEMVRSGTLLATGGMLPSATGARVRLDGNTFSVTDGPFTEVKELIGGYAIVEAASKPEAIELARRFLKVTGRGECEVRPMFPAPDLSNNPGAHPCAETSTTR